MAMVVGGVASRSKGVVETSWGEVIGRTLARVIGIMRLPSC